MAKGKAWQDKCEAFIASVCEQVSAREGLKPGQAERIGHDYAAQHFSAAGVLDALIAEAVETAEKKTKKTVA